MNTIVYEIYSKFLRNVEEVYRSHYEQCKGNQWESSDFFFSYFFLMEGVG